MVLGLALSMVCYILFAGWRPFSLPIPLAVFPILIGLFIFAITNPCVTIRIPNYWIRWFMVLVVMFIWRLFVDLINDTLESSIEKVNAFLFVFSFAVLVSISIYHKDQIRSLIFATVCAVAFSSMIAILQLSPHREPFLALWRWRYMCYAPKEMLPRLEELYTFILNGRAAGMTPYSLTLAHQILVSTPLALALLFTERQRKNFVLITLCFIILVLGALATGARIAIFIGLFFTILYFLWIQKLFQGYYLKLFVILILMLTVIIFLTMLSLKYLTFHLRFLTVGEVQRIETWKFIINLILEHPYVLLVGISEGGLSRWGIPVDVLGSAHNQFLGALIGYGFPGLLLLSYFYLQTFSIILHKFKQNPYNQHKKQNKDFIVYRLCFTISLLGYITASLFHDQGPLTADVFHLVTLSIFVILPRCYVYQYISKCYSKHNYQTIPQISH
ncbi:MAG: O-antigen ligase family protein [Nitrososphaerota archaeon]